MVRPFRDSDVGRLKQIHKQMGLGYELPAAFFSLVVANGSDEAEQAILLRPSAEMFYLRDPHAGTPKERWEKFLELHEEMRKLALSLNLSEVEAFLPPPVERFGERLMSIGWQKNLWQPYTFSLEKPNGARAETSR